MEEDIRKNQTACIIGRFQTPYLHLGHIYLISNALQHYKFTTILLGESLRRDERNPYTIGQRIRMIERIFNFMNFEVGMLVDVPGNNEAWSQSIDKILDEIPNPVLLHSRDSFAPHYKGKYPLVEIPELEGFSGTELRKSQNKI
jgi:bifunctional NMN adenylyltransferase/nudix hydrolase